MARPQKNPNTTHTLQLLPDAKRVILWKKMQMENDCLTDDDCRKKPMHVNLSQALNALLIEFGSITGIDNGSCNKVGGSPERKKTVEEVLASSKFRPADDQAA